MEPSHSSPPHQVLTRLLSGHAVEARSMPTGAEVWLPREERPIPVRDWDRQPPRRNAWGTLAMLFGLAALLTAWILL